MNALVASVGLALPGVTHPGELPGGPPPGAAPVDPAARLGRKGLRYHDHATRLGLCAARDALRAAGLTTDRPAEETARGNRLRTDLTVPAASVAVVVSSNLGNLDSVCEVADGIAADGGTRLLSPVIAPRLSSNVIASEVAIRFGLRGPNLTLCNGATSGLDAAYWALSLLAAGRARYVLVLGVEPDNAAVRRLTGLDRVLDGAVALVLEPDRAAVAGVRVSGYVRTADLRGCLAALSQSTDAEVGAWYVPEGGPFPDDLLARVPRHDLAGGWGAASGALGVLQCAAAVGHWAAPSGGAGGAGDAGDAGDASGAVFAVAGTDADDAVAGLVLRHTDGG